MGALWAPLYGFADDEPSATAPASGRVVRAVLTNKVKGHEPVDSLSVLSNNKTRIYYFTEIAGMAGQTVTHRWEYNDKVVHTLPLKIDSARWRAHSSKTLNPAWLGEWKVSVVDAAGGTLSVNTFTYRAIVNSKPIRKPSR